MEKLLFFTFILVCGIFYITNKYYAVGRVRGFSMFPTFSDGEIIIIERIFELKKGEVYVFKSPNEEKFLIKRLNEIIISPCNAEIFLYFLGDNVEDSIDSRVFGMIKPENVVGKVRKLFRRRKDERLCNHEGKSRD
jgi:signal peptidase I